MADKYFEDQLDDEEVLYVFRKHPVVMRKGIVLAALGPLIGILPVAVKTQLGVGWFFGGLGVGQLLGMVLIFPYWIAWYYSVFIITNQRFIQITQKGLFHRSIVDLSLAQIQSLNYEVNGIQETLLGYGTILMQTYVGDLVIHDIHHPGDIYKKMTVILRDLGLTPSTTSTKETENLDEETT
jgi:hypothetical protein